MKEWFKKSDKLVLASFIISMAVLFHNIRYWGTTMEDFTGILGFILVLPNLIFLLVGFILNSIALFKESKWLCFSAGLFYGLAILLFPPYVIFSLAQAIMCLISFSKKDK